MFVCPACGYGNHEGDLFCEACGTYFHTGGSLATEDLGDTAPSKPSPSGFPRPEAEHGPAIVALHLMSESDNRQFSIDASKPTTLIGRSERKARLFVDVDITGEEGQAHGVSRRHARAHFLNGRFLLEDLESLNGTYLNGRKLRPYLPEVLHDGDEVKLGNLVLKVSLVEPA